MKYLFIFFTITFLFSCRTKEETESVDADSTLIEDYEKIDGQVYRAF
jgi:hypothetical protein